MNKHAEAIIVTLAMMLVELNAKISAYEPAALTSGEYAEMLVTAREAHSKTVSIAKRGEGRATSAALTMYAMVVGNTLSVGLVTFEDLAHAAGVVAGIRQGYEQGVTDGVFQEFVATQQIEADNRRGIEEQETLRALMDGDN